MRRASIGIWLTCLAAWGSPALSAEANGTRGASFDPAAAERGRIALTLRGFLKPEWSAPAFATAGRLWDFPAPDFDRDPAAYRAAFERRYGLHPAPYPNDGLPMGLRRGINPDGTKSTGFQVDCMVCHGGSIGGRSYVGLGNTQLDLGALGRDLTTADGRRPPPPVFVVNTSRGTTNAGMMAAVLISLRNSDLSRRIVPLPLGASFAELDAPAWWLLKRKQTMYFDGRTNARSVRTNMQFMLGEKTLQQFKDLEPTFRDVREFLLSLEPPRYPFAIDTEKAERGRTVFSENCARCHGTYGPNGRYPSKIVPLDVIGTDPARAKGASDRLVAHYNTTWFAEKDPVNPRMIGYQAPPLDGIWATAPYLHNGTVPTLHAILDSSSRPRRFTRPPSTGFENYDTTRVGWKHREVSAAELAATARRSAFEAGFLVDTSRYGMNNDGHTFGDELTEDERMDLIEYLKTL